MLTVALAFFDVTVAVVLAFVIATAVVKFEAAIDRSLTEYQPESYHE